MQAEIISKAAGMAESGLQKASKDYLACVMAAVGIDATDCDQVKRKHAAYDNDEKSTKLLDENDIDGKSVTLFVSFKRHRCCFGCFSLRTAARLIALAESIALVLLSIELIHFYVQDGVLFYTNELKGTGAHTAKWGAVFVSSGLLTVVAMLISLPKHVYWLAAPHLGFQVASISYMLYIAAQIWKRAKSDYPIREHQLLTPTAIVLIIQITLPTVLQIWFFLVCCELVWYMRKVRLAVQRSFTIDFNWKNHSAPCQMTEGANM